MKIRNFRKPKNIILCNFAFMHKTEMALSFCCKKCAHCVFFFNDIPIYIQKKGKLGQHLFLIKEYKSNLWENFIDYVEKFC